MEKLIVTDVYEIYPVKLRLPIDLSLCHLEIDCVKLESLPKGVGQLKLLKYLSLARCRHLTSLPESVWELESLVELNLMMSGLKGFSGKIESMTELKVLNLSHTNIRTLPEGIGVLVKLEELDLSFCLDLELIPSEIGNLFSLRFLNLRKAGIVELPSNVIRLSRLQHLYLTSCWKLRKVKQLPTSLSHLSLPYFLLQVVPDLSNLVNIVQLELGSHDGIYLGHHRTDDEEDEEDRWTRFRSLDVASIERLPRLKWLGIEVELGLSCSDTQSLSQLPHNLNELCLIKFRATTLDLSLFPNLKNLSNLFISAMLSDEIELRGLEVLGNLQRIVVQSCHSLARLSIASCPKNLNSLVIMDCRKLVEVEGVSRLESLQNLRLFGCPSLLRLSDLSNLMKMKMKMKNPLNLVVSNCGKLRNFNGPHDLYVDIIEGPARCLIL